MWWGLSPALDLLSELNAKDINILLIGQCDARHILKTLAKKYRHRGSRVKIFVQESSMDVIAKSLLLLSIALEENQGLGKKAQIFLDIYGNTLIRPATRQYLTEAAQRLVKIVTNFNYAQNVLPFISLDSLKYRDRDQLENIFKYWASGDDFDILNYWDQKMRVALGTRYDSRLGVFDWDLHMRFRPYGAEVVSTQEYKVFREKGIAFFQEDTDPCVPNPTMASFAPGSKKPAGGIFGDQVTGPYPSYGLDCEERSLLDKCNGLHRYNASEITLWNIHQILYEIKHQKPYTPPKGDLKNPCIRRDPSEQIKLRTKNFQKSNVEDNYSACIVPDVDIIFLPITALKDYPGKPHFQLFFDLVTVPQYLVPKLPDNWHAMCKPDCKLLVESSKYILSMGKDALEKSKKDTEDFVKNIGGEALDEFDYKKHDLMRFLIKK